MGWIGPGCLPECWIALFLLRLATGSHLPQFTFWRK